VERENREGFQEQCRSEEKARDPGRRSLHALTTYPILLSDHNTIEIYEEGKDLIHFRLTEWDKRKRENKNMSNILEGIHTANIPFFFVKNKLNKLAYSLSL
jgi:hypothetical protein